MKPRKSPTHTPPNDVQLRVARQAASRAHQTLARVLRNAWRGVLATVVKIETFWGMSFVEVAPASPTPGEPWTCEALGMDRAVHKLRLQPGELTMLSGPSGSGKTRLALQAIASAQSAGMCAAYFDCAAQLDPGYLVAAGLQTQHVLIASPPDVESALTIAGIVASMSPPFLIVIDGLDCLPLRNAASGASHLHGGADTEMMSAWESAARSLRRQVAGGHSALLAVFCTPPIDAIAARAFTAFRNYASTQWTSHLFRAPRPANRHQHGASFPQHFNASATRFTPVRSGVPRLR